MQQDWGRRHAFVDLALTTFATMLEPVFPGRQIETVELLMAGLCNTNYKFTVAGLKELFVLRIYIRDHSAAERDQHILTQIKDTVPVPTLLYVDTTCKRYDYAYAVMSWVEGVLLSTILQSGDNIAIEECAHTAGLTLARIGTHHFAQAGFFAPDLTIAEPIENFGNACIAVIQTSLSTGYTGHYLGPARAKRLAQFVSERSDYFQTINGLSALVHSDFKSFNILVQPLEGHWNITAVLDWEFACAGPPIFDIGNMLRYEHQLTPTFESEFINGYRENGGHLPPAWKRVAKLVDLTSLCQLLDTPDARAGLQTEIIGLIDHTLTHWQSYPEA